MLINVKSRKREAAQPVRFDSIQDFHAMITALPRSARRPPAVVVEGVPFRMRRNPSTDLPGFVAPSAILGRTCVVSNGALVFPNAYIGPHTTIGGFSLIYGETVLENGVRIGNNCVVHPLTVIKIGVETRFMVWILGGTVGGITVIGAWSNIGANVQIGKDVVTGPHVRITDNAVLPDGKRLGAFTTFSETGLLHGANGTGSKPILRA